MIEIKPITAEETHPLRQKVLRPHQAITEMLYPNDDHPNSFHVGAFEGSQNIGIGSMYPEGRKGDLDIGEWRIRGMAVDPDIKGKGLGGKLLLSMLSHAEAENAELVWCNARTSACGFYERYGFVKEGDEFDIPGIGPHYVMVKRFD